MFKKSVVVGVSITPESGLEVAQIDYASRTILKYGRKAIDYNIVRREIADVDIFKENLKELLSEQDVPKNAAIVFSFPTVYFKVAPYPAHMDTIEIEAVISDEIYDNQYLRETEPSISYAIVEEDMQNKRVAYTAIQSQALTEIIMDLRENGYTNIMAADASMDSVLNALVYLSENKLAADSTKNWVMLTVENSCCRVALMTGRHYVDIAEIKISIGDVLSDAENYSIVTSAVDPILQQFPASFLYIVSKTNVISAEALTDRVTYNAPILYFDANSYRKDDMFGLIAAPNLDPMDIRGISLDAVGAAIYSDCTVACDMKFNYYNKTLGDIYTSMQPITLCNGKIVLDVRTLLIAFCVILIVLSVLCALAFGFYYAETKKMHNNIEDMQNEISKLDEYINARKNFEKSDFNEGKEIMDGIEYNKNIYSYYQVVGTEIPKKLWLTHLKLGDKTTIEGQADNIESIYAFYRNMKDIIPTSDFNPEISLQKLNLATNDTESFKEYDPEAVLTMMDADFYEFCISNDANAASAASNNTPPGDIPEVSN